MTGTVEVADDTEVLIINDADASEIVVLSPDDVETISVGDQGPPGPPGEKGDKGAKGDKGDEGDQGQRGSLWFEGSNPPGTISGQQEEDNYLDATNGDVYTLTGGVWTLAGNIRGPVGPQGPMFPDAPSDTKYYARKDAAWAQITPFVDAPNDGSMYARKNQGWVSFGTAAVLLADAAPVGAPDNALWWESDTGNLYVRYNDGNTAQWVMVASPINYGSIPAVRYDIAQVLTSPQKQQARQNIAAAPFDAMQYNGLQINGNFEIAQERGSNPLTITTGQAAYILDLWQIGYNSAAIASFTGMQIVFGTGGQPFGLQLSSCLYMKSGSAGTVGGGSGDNCFMGTVVEGTRWSRLGYGHVTAKPLTASFWIAATRAGTYSLSFRNSAVNRTYIAPFTHGGGTFWEFKQISIPGCPDGTWDRGTGVGCYVGVNLGAGSATKAPADNTWLSTAGGYMGSVAQTSAFSAANDEVYLAGFHLVPGNEGPPSDRIASVLRPGDDELRLCQRHLQYVITGARFTATGAGQVVEDITRFPVPMRGIPTMTLIGTPPVGSSNVQAGYPQIQTPSNQAFRFMIASNAAGDCYHLYQSAKADARM